MKGLSAELLAYRHAVVTCAGGDSLSMLPSVPATPLPASAHFLDCLLIAIAAACSTPLN